MRASSALAINASKAGSQAAHPGLEEPRPRATLGYLLDERGPEALSDVAESLAQAAIVDSRVLIAHRWGVDESIWPTPADRFASDLHRWQDVVDPWLSALTKSAAESRLPVLLGGHSLVGPGIPLLLG